jgi:hypothetical protein
MSFAMAAIIVQANSVCCRQAPGSHNPAGSHQKWQVQPISNDMTIGRSGRWKLEGTAIRLSLAVPTPLRGDEGPRISASSCYPAYERDNQNVPYPQ